MELLELSKFFNESDLLKLKHKLTNYFDSLNSLQKNEFIELVEYRYLPYYRSKIKTDNEKLGLQSVINIFLEKIQFIEQWVLNNKSSETTNHFDNNLPLKKDSKKQGWFKVAVLFASGKMQKFYTINSKNEFVIKPEYTAPKIAKDLNIPDYHKEILATLNNYKKDNSNGKKNIFNRTSTELKEVIKYCENKKYDLTPDFIERYNLIKDK